LQKWGFEFCPISAFLILNLSMKSSIKHRLFPRAIVFAAIIAATSTGLLAKDHGDLNYLKDSQPDATNLLAPPPLLGSAEQAADMAEVHAIYGAASSNDVAEAYSEKSFTVFNFAGAAGPFFVEGNLPKTAAFFAKVQSDAATITDASKNYFKRPRPYTTDPTLANGKPEKSFSYPSGHSTESMVLALVLADLLPDKHDAILAHARSIGWHRVEIARHYPTDIYAGRVLAMAIVNQFKNSHAFRKDFEAVKAELAAAQKEGALKALAH
jgi:acid phosphatase (class A)